MPILKNQLTYFREKALDELFVKFVGRTEFNGHEISGRRRERQLCAARYYVAKNLHDSGFSYPKIGKVINRDHSSVMYLINNFKYKNLAEKYS